MAQKRFPKIARAIIILYLISHLFLSYENINFIAPSTRENQEERRGFVIYVKRRLFGHYSQFESRKGQFSVA